MAGRARRTPRFAGCAIRAGIRYPARAAAARSGSRTDADATDTAYYVEVGGGPGQAAQRGLRDAVLRSIDDTRGSSDEGTRYSLRSDDVTDIAADTTTTGRVAVGGSVPGNIETAGDRDWFAATLEAGKTYQIDLRGRWTGMGTLSDPYLPGIYDAGGDLIDRTTDDNGGWGRDSRVTFRTTDPGIYYVSAGARENNIGTFTLSVTDIEAVDDFASNIRTTARVTVGASVTGSVDYDGDRDWFAVTLEAGKTYRFDLEGARTHRGTLPDPYLRGIYDAHGNLIDRTTDDNGGVSVNSRMYYTADADAAHYVSAGKYGGGLGSYTLSVTEIVDDYTADTATTGTIGLNRPASGEIEFPNDRDWFAVTLEAGRTYRFQLEGSGTYDEALIATVLAGIHDSGGNFIRNTTAVGGLTRYTDKGVWYTSRVAFTADADDTYYVAVGTGFDTGAYTLSMSRVADDFAAGTWTSGTVEGRRLGNWRNQLHGRQRLVCGDPGSGPALRVPREGSHYSVDSQPRRGIQG